MKNMQVSIQDFSGVYEEQPFMRKMKESARAITDNKSLQISARWFDCREISGTDCYCDDEAKEILKSQICTAPPGSTATRDCTAGIHFFDNGNYHYMSKLWTDEVQEPFDLIVFDHHPDMQPPRFEGILSCGGWVKEVLDKNGHAGRVMIIGVADHLIDEIGNDPTAEFNKYSNRVTFMPESTFAASDTESTDKFITSTGNLKEWLLRENERPVYISIDKDVLSTKDAVTNWDQGSMTFAQMEKMLRMLFESRQVLGVDICGERADNQSYADGMDESSADSINSKLNEKLFQLLQNLYVHNLI